MTLAQQHRLASAAIFTAKALWKASDAGLLLAGAIERGSERVNQLGHTVIDRTAEKLGDEAAEG